MELIQKLRLIREIILTNRGGGTSEALAEVAAKKKSIVFVANADTGQRFGKDAFPLTNIDRCRGRSRGRLGPVLIDTCALDDLCLEAAAALSAKDQEIKELKARLNTIQALSVTEIKAVNADGQPTSWFPVPMYPFGSAGFVDLHKNNSQVDSL